MGREMPVGNGRSRQTHHKLDLGQDPIYYVDSHSLTSKGNYQGTSGVRILISVQTLSLSPRISRYSQFPSAVTWINGHRSLWRKDMGITCHSITGSFFWRPSHLFSQGLSGLNTGLGLETGQKIVPFHWTPVSNSSPLDFFGWYKLDSTLTNYWAICPRNTTLLSGTLCCHFSFPSCRDHCGPLVSGGLKHCPWPLLFGRSYHYHSY